MNEVDYLRKQYLLMFQDKINDIWIQWVKEHESNWHKRFTIVIAA